MVRISWERRKSYVNVLKNGTHSTLPRNLHIRALSGGSIRPVRHTNVASGRLIGTFRMVLYNILGTRRLTDEVLNTTFCLVEHALNARPLTIGVTIQLLGLRNSATAPTASLISPTYARRPDRLSANSLSLYHSSQHFLPGRMMLPRK